MPNILGDNYYILKSIITLIKMLLSYYLVI